MANWVVLEPPADQPGKDLVFVRDDFRWLGFIAPPLWLAWHRLWLAAIVTVAALVAINVVIASGHVAPIFSWLSLLVSLFVGLEGPAMRIAALRRSGYEDTVALTAETLEDAELRYLDWLDSDRGTAPSVQAAPVTASHAGRPALGLLGYPGRS